MATELLSVMASLAAAVAWGSGDFGGGLASRTFDALRVVILAQLVGTTVLLVIALVSGDPLPPWPLIIVAALAGLAGSVGLMLLYEALAIGPMGVVAPLAAAVSGALPALVGIVLEGWPGVTQLGGFVIALIAVWVISSPGEQAELSRRALVLAITAGAGFAVFLTVMARLGSYGTYWPLVTGRVASITLLGALVLARSTPRTGGPIPWALIVLAGLGDTAGNVFFVQAAQLGRLDVAAVISSLYPAATLLLARGFLDERLAPRQLVGVGLALVAIILIAI